MNFLQLHRNACFIFAMLLCGTCSAQTPNENARALSLAKQNACLGCHAVNKKIVGPGFQEVAKKYAGDPSAHLFLKNKIQKGGAGSWGVVPMPGNAKLGDADLSLLTSWILRGAPSAN